MLISVIPSKGQIIEAVRNIEMVEKITTTINSYSSTIFQSIRIKKGQKFKVLGGYRLLDRDGAIFLQLDPQDIEYTFGWKNIMDQLKLKTCFFNGNFAVNQTLRDTKDIVYKDGDEAVHRFSDLEL